MRPFHSRSPSRRQPWHHARPFWTIGGGIKERGRSQSTTPVYSSPPDVHLLLLCPSDCRERLEYFGCAARPVPPHPRTQEHVEEVGQPRFTIVEERHAVDVRSRRAEVCKAKVQARSIYFCQCTRRYSSRPCHRRRRTRADSSGYTAVDAIEED